MSVATVSTAPGRKFSKNPFIAFYHSSIGKKYIVAITAILLVLYVLGDLLGNLQIYLGPDRIQTLGIDNRKISGFVSSGSQILEWLVFAGYVSIPVTILLGIIK